MLTVLSLTHSRVCDRGGSPARLRIALGWRWVGALSWTGWICLHTRTSGLGHRLRRNLWRRAALVL